MLAYPCLFYPQLRQTSVKAPVLFNLLRERKSKGEWEKRERIGFKK